MKDQNTNTPKKTVFDLLDHIDMPIPFDADIKYVQQHCNWDNLVSDLKTKTIIENCHFVAYPDVQYAEIPYLGNFQTAEIIAGADLDNLSYDAKMLHIDRRFFTASIIIDKMTLQAHGDKINEFYKGELKKQLYVNIEKLVMDEIKNKVDNSAVFSSVQALTYEDLIHLTKNLETFNSKLSFVMDKQILDTLRTTKKSTGTSYIIENGMIDKYPAQSSVHLQNEIIVGDFSKIAVVSFSPDFCSIQYNPYKYIRDGKILIQAFCDANVGMIDTSAFKRFILQG